MTKFLLLEFSFSFWGPRIEFYVLTNQKDFQSHNLESPHMHKTLSILVILLLQCHPVWAACRRRTEWSKLTSSQRTRYLNALNRLKSRPMAGSDADASTISYDDFSQWHVDNGMTAHGTVSVIYIHIVATILTLASMDVMAI
jgi:hypothetical protein